MWLKFRDSAEYRHVFNFCLLNVCAADSTQPRADSGKDSDKRRVTVHRCPWLVS